MGEINNELNIFLLLYNTMETNNVASIFRTLVHLDRSELNKLFMNIYGFDGSYVKLNTLVA